MKKTHKRTELKTKYTCEADLLNKGSIKLLKSISSLLPCSTAFVFLPHCIFLFRSYNSSIKIVFMYLFCLFLNFSVPRKLTCLTEETQILI